MEVLVVIGIIVLLAGLLLPTLSRAKSKGHQAGCISNQRQIALASALYLTEQDRKFPIALQRFGTDTDPIIAFDDLLYPYLGGPALTRVEVEADRIPITKRVRTLTCPADKVPPEPAFNTPGTWRRSYSMPQANMGGLNNGTGPLGMVASGGIGLYYSSYWAPKIQPGVKPMALREERVEGPAETLAYVERIDSRNFAGNDHFGVTKGTGEQRVGVNFTFRSHHGARMAYAYCDQHVEVLRPEQTWGSAGDESTLTGQWTIRQGD